MDPRETATKNILLLGALLTILGVGTFALIRFDPAKWTALIPAAFGVLFLLLGSLAQRHRAWHPYLVYTALTLALFAFLGTADGLLKVAALMTGDDIKRPAAALEEAITAVLCVGYLGVTVKGIVETRRANVSESA